MGDASDYDAQVVPALRKKLQSSPAETQQETADDFKENIALTAGDGPCTPAHGAPPRPFLKRKSVSQQIPKEKLDFSATKPRFMQWADTLPMDHNSRGHHGSASASGKAQRESSLVASCYRYKLRAGEGNIQRSAMPRNNETTSSSPLQQDSFQRQHSPTRASAMRLSAPPAFLEAPGVT